jgi:hypothetical protein
MCVMLWLSSQVRKAAQTLRLWRDALAIGASSQGGAKIKIVLVCLMTPRSSTAYDNLVAICSA